MSTKNKALTTALAIIALVTILVVECLVTQTEVEPVEPEKTVTPDEPERPIIIIPVEPVEPVEEPAPPLPPEPTGRPYNRLYQYGYGEPNEPDEPIPTPEPIDPRRHVLKGGWVIIIDPNGSVEPVEAPRRDKRSPGLRKFMENLRKKREALKEKWKHRA